MPLLCGPTKQFRSQWLSTLIVEDLTSLDLREAQISHSVGSQAASPGAPPTESLLQRISIFAYLIETLSVLSVSKGTLSFQLWLLDYAVVISCNQNVLPSALFSCLILQHIVILARVEVDHRFIHVHEVNSLYQFARRLWSDIDIGGGSACILVFDSFAIITLLGWLDWLGCFSHGHFGHFRSHISAFVKNSFVTLDPNIQAFFHIV